MSLVRHESRLIRPFLHADELKNALSGAAIRLKAGGPMMTEEVHVIKSEDSLLLEPALIMGLDSSAAIAVLEKLGIPPTKVELFVIGTSHEMRLSKTLFRFSLDSIPEGDVELLPEIRRFLSAKGGCDISLALLLSEDLPAEALKPHAFGQWLARKTFCLRPEQPNNEFHIAPLTEKERERLKLPSGTVYFVEKVGSLNDPEAKLQDCLTIWVSEQVFNALTRDSAPKVSAAIQKAMLSEVIVSVVVLEAADLEGGMPEAGSPLDAFFDDLAKDSKVAKEKLVQYARPNGDAPERVRIFV